MNWKTDDNKIFRIDSAVIKNYFNKTADLVFTDEAARIEEKTLLNFVTGEKLNVLDLGCGNGRWATVLENKISKYVGVDFSDVFIEQAKKKHKNRKFIFISQPADTFVIQEKFELILIIGLMTYLNDEQIENMVINVKNMLSNEGIVIVRNVSAPEFRNGTLRKVYDRKLNFIERLLGRKRYQLIRRNPENEIGYFKSLKLIHQDFIENTGYVFYIFKNNEQETP